MTDDIMALSALVVKPQSQHKVLKNRRYYPDQDSLLNKNRRKSCPSVLSYISAFGANEIFT